MKERIVLCVVMAFLITTLSSIIVAAEDEIPQGLTIEVLKSPDNIAPNSVSLYIYNITNHGQARELEVSAMGIPDDVYVDIIPEHFNLTPEQNIYIFVYVRTGDTPLGEDFNLILKVEDVNQRAVSATHEFSVSIAEQALTQMSFDISGWPGFRVIPVKNNPNAEVTIDAETEGTYDYLYYYLKQDTTTFEDITKTETAFVYIPSDMTVNTKTSSNIGSYCDVRYDASLDKFTVATHTMTVKYSITNIGTSVLNDVNIQWEDVSEEGTVLSDLGPTYMGPRYISISSSTTTSALNDNSLGALANLEYTSRAFSNENDTQNNMFSPTPALRSINAMTAYANTYTYAHENKWIYSPTQVSKVAYSNVMPINSVPSRGFITGTLDTTSFTTTTSFSPDISTEPLSNEDIFAKSSSDAITSGKLHVSGTMVGDGEFYTGATSETLPSIDDATGSIEVTPTPDKTHTGQIDDNIDITFNIKDYITNTHPEVLSTAGYHTIVAYTILKTYVTVDTGLDTIKRNVISMIPIVINLYVNPDAEVPDPPQPPSPSEKLPMKAVKVIKDITISTDADSIVLEDANSRADIKIDFSIVGSVMNYNPDVYDYQGSDILDIEISVVGMGIERDNSYIALDPSSDEEETSLIGGTSETPMTMDTVLNSATRSADTYTPSIFNGWTVSLDKTYIEKAPDSVGKYSLSDTLTLTVLPPNDAKAGDRFIFKLVITIPGAYQFVPVEDVPSVGSDLGNQVPLPSDSTSASWNEVLSNSMVVQQNSDGTFTEVFTKYSTSTNTRALGDGVLLNTVFTSTDFTTDAVAGDAFELSASKIADDMTPLLYVTAGIFMGLIIVIVSIVAMLYIQSRKRYG